MKDPKFYVGIVIGFSMSLVLLSIGFIVGPAYAAPMIGTNDIVDDAIISPKIKDGEVKTQDLAPGAVTSGKISPFALKLLTVVRHADFTIAAPNTGALGQVNCAKGELATGGGYWHQASPQDQGLITFLNVPFPTGWSVGIKSPDGNTHQFTAYVICAHLEVGP